MRKICMPVSASRYSAALAKLLTVSRSRSRTSCVARRTLSASHAAWLVSLRVASLSLSKFLTRAKNSMGSTGLDRKSSTPDSSAW